MLSQLILCCSHFVYLLFSEFDSTEQVFVNAYPWLFPGGIGDVYDPRRGKVKDIHAWAKHLLRYKLVCPCSAVCAVSMSVLQCGPRGFALVGMHVPVKFLLITISVYKVALQR